MTNNASISDEQLFREKGYRVVRGFLSDEQVARLREQALSEMATLQEPIEYEADVGYPGSPARRDAPGGTTPRRLLSAYARHPLWAQLATSPDLKKLLAPLLGEPPLLSQSHHNCIMTKHPGYSSSTNWHQDMRYWAFAKPELISAWIALTEEHAANGALLLIPGSHRMKLEPGQFDDRQFFRPESPHDVALVESAIQVELQPGDLLLFHCRALHAAGKNETSETKLSAVFTYHGASNQPKPGTRSAYHPPIPL